MAQIRSSEMSLDEYGYRTPGEKSNDLQSLPLTLEHVLFSDFCQQKN